MESQPNARSALRLEALLPDPIEEDREQRKRTKELKTLLNREEQFRGNFIFFLIAIQSFQNKVKSRFEINFVKLTYYI